MCNVWNTNARCCQTTTNGNGCYTQVNTNGCGYNGNVWTIERICRDCNGGLWVRVGYTCPYQPTCGCLCGNGTTQNTTDNGTTGTGFGCVTLCGRVGNVGTTTTTATGGDAYYARQYGLCGGTRTCCGGYTQ